MADTDRLKQLRVMNPEFAKAEARGDGKSSSYWRWGSGTMLEPS